MATAMRNVKWRREARDGEPGPPRAAKGFWYGLA